MKNIIVVLTILIGFFYCLRFGFIWTAYGHGGQLLGIPFAFLQLILGLFFLFSKAETKKRKYFLISIIYFLTFLAISLTIEIIRSSMSNYFEFLYYDDGYVDKIFLAWLIIGLMVLIFLLKKIKG